MVSIYHLGGIFILHGVLWHTCVNRRENALLFGSDLGMPLLVSLYYYDMQWKMDVWD